MKEKSTEQIAKILDYKIVREMSPDEQDKLIENLQKIDRGLERFIENMKDHEANRYNNNRNNPKRMQTNNNHK